MVLSINPHTPVSSLNAIITDIDLVCLMSVNPGFGGQSFIENTYKKVEELIIRNLIEKTNSRALIEVDAIFGSFKCSKIQIKSMLNN